MNFIPLRGKPAHQMSDGKKRRNETSAYCNQNIDQTFWTEIVGKLNMNFIPHKGKTAHQMSDGKKRRNETSAHRN